MCHTHAVQTPKYHLHLPSLIWQDLHWRQWKSNIYVPTKSCLLMTDKWSEVHYKNTFSSAFFFLCCSSTSGHSTSKDFMILWEWEEGKTIPQTKIKDTLEKKNHSYQLVMCEPNCTAPWLPVLCSEIKVSQTASHKETCGLQHSLSYLEKNN